MLSSSDFEWVIETLSGTADKGKRSLLIALSWALFLRDSTTHINLLVEACRKHPDLRRRFREQLQPVRLGSPKARRMQAEFRVFERIEKGRSEAQERHATDERNRPTLGTIQRIVTEKLSAIPGDPYQTWACTANALAQVTESTRHVSSFALDLTRTEAWGVLDKPTRENLAVCARSCLESVDPATERWMGTSEYNWGAFYGVRALVVLFRCTDMKMATLSDELVGKWFPTLLAFPGYWSDDEKTGLGDVLSALTARCPGVLLDAVQRLLAGLSSATNPATEVLERLETLWSGRIAQLILETASRSDIGDDTRHQCLKVLLDHEVEGARDIANRVINKGASDSSAEAAGKAALSTAVTVMSSCHDWWDSLWPIMHDNPLFGRLVILKTAGPYRYGTGTPFDDLTDEQTGIFYIWLTEQFPEEDYFPNAGGHRIADAESVYERRHRLLERLRNGQSQAAVDALKKIRKRFPTHIWLPLFISESESNLAARVWTPVPVRDLCTLLDRPRARYVSTEDELLDVVSEQISALQLKLHGETPMWRFLWNDITVARRHIRQPKEEADISDWVKEQLELSLSGTRVVVNREVEIQRGTGGKEKGKRTDVKVDATSHEEPHNRLRVIIETKGCWNTGLLDDMEGQLARRYLTESGCTRGVYLVGWFNWEEWDDGDARRRKAIRQVSQKKLQATLALQAEGLKSEGFMVVPIVLDFTPPPSSRSAPKRKGT